MKLSKGLLIGSAAITLALAAPAAMAQKKYDTGASDTEIRIGNTMPYSGPASAYGTIGKVESAYFRMINEQGGINGRKINFITTDDGYAPPKTVEMTRKLVEQDEVLAMFSSLGSTQNSAVHKYLNAKKVPQLFVGSGASHWDNAKGFPWTMGWQPNYQAEGRIYAQHILKTSPNARIAVLMQNDDFGKDYLKGLKDGLGAKASMIVAEASYEVTDPTVDSQVVQLKASGADVFVNLSSPKFTAQSVRKVHDMGWKPTQYVPTVSISVGSVLTPAGLDKSIGLISTTYMKDPTDPAWASDPAMQEWRAFMAKYYPEGNLADNSNVFGYAIAQTLVHVLRACGDNLTRENIMKQAASLKDMQIALLLPGVRLNTGAEDFAPIQSMQLMKFDGRTWVRFGEVMGN